MAQHDEHSAKTPAEDAVDHHWSTDRPGALRGEVWITIQTRQAQRLVTGRKPTPDKPAIIGLTRFGSLTSLLHFCARLDDPYADWWLLKVEAALDQASAQIERMRQQVEALLAEHPGMQIELAESLEPVRIPLKFGNPYAYQGARLLTDFDALIRALLTARHVGFLDRDRTEKQLHLSGRAIRRALACAVGFKNQSTRRKDLEQNTARAMKARECMGEVPPDIMDRSRRARLAPEPASTTTTHGIQTDLHGFNVRPRAFDFKGHAAFKPGSRLPGHESAKTTKPQD